jgi:hypothetical protein
LYVYCSDWSRDSTDISNSSDKEKLMPSLRHEKYRPFIGPDLGDRTWPSQQIENSASLVLSRFARWQSGLD